MSETSRCRDRLKEYLIGDFVLDCGFGGSSCLPGKALTMDMPIPYCPSLEGHQQTFKGDYRNLDFLCDEVVSALWNSHVVEDWIVSDQIALIKEFRRVLKSGGNLIIICPDEAVYRGICDRTGQCHNDNHKISNYSLELFRREVLPHTGSWEVLLEIPLIDEYSWNLILRKI